MNIARWGLFGVLIGCSYTSEKFEEDFAEEYCEFVQSCSPPFHDDIEDCKLDLAGDRPDAECEYDKDIARECTDALTGLQCTGAASNYPDACDQVYTCS